jgi:hypothetical protein
MGEEPCPPGLSRLDPLVPLGVGPRRVDLPCVSQQRRQPL